MIDFKNYKADRRIPTMSDKASNIAFAVVLFIMFFGAAIVEAIL